MNVVGVVCEYNPMHKGHLYQIEKIKEIYPESIIVVVFPGCFTQRGDICIINKWDKTRIALNNGIDLVIELPFVYATQSSDIFARGAISLLNYLGVRTIVFGSESNDIDKLTEIVKTQLYNKDYNGLVKDYLDTGINYPSAMSRALKDILGYSVNEPNDLLGISYIKEILRNNYNMNYMSIKRINNYHSKKLTGDIINASLIREMILEDKDVSKYVVDDSDNFFYNNLCMNKSFDFLKYKIYTCDLSKIQTVDEGLDNKLKVDINNSNSWDELVFKVKSKRYTFNKINRMLLHILCNFTKEEANNIGIDYIRLLGFSIKGQKYLNSIKKIIDIPIITHYKSGISNIFDIEYRITCVYSIITNDKCIINDEISHKPIIVRD